MLEIINSCFTCKQSTTEPNSNNLNFSKGLVIHANSSVGKKDAQTAEEVFGLNISLHEVDIEDGSFVAELVRWGLLKYSNNIRLLPYNSHINYVANIQASFDTFRYPTLECYFCQPIKLERNDIQRLVLGDKRTFLPRVGIGWIEPFLTSWIFSIYHTRTERSSFQKQPLFTLIQYVYWTKKISQAQRQIGLKNPFQHHYQIEATYVQILVVLVIVIHEKRFCRLWMHWSI